MTKPKESRASRNVNMPQLIVSELDKFHHSKSENNHDCNPELLMTLNGMESAPRDGAFIRLFYLSEQNPILCCSSIRQFDEFTWPNGSTTIEWIDENRCIKRPSVIYIGWQAKDSQ